MNHSPSEPPNSFERPQSDCWKGQLLGVEDGLVDAAFGFGWSGDYKSDEPACQKAEARQASASKDAGSQPFIVVGKDREKANTGLSPDSDRGATPEETCGEHEATVPEENFFVATLERSGSLQRFSQVGFQGWGSLQSAVNDLNVDMAL